MKKLLPFILIVLLSCSEKKSQYPQVIISTSMGDIEAELYPEKAPKTVAAFLHYIDSGYYKDAESILQSLAHTGFKAGNFHN